MTAAQAGYLPQKHSRYLPNLGIAMDVTGLVTNLIRAELEPADLARQPFRPGQVLHLEVLEVLSASRARVDLGKFQAVADIQFPVVPGDKLEVEVEAVGRQLRLHALSPDDSTAGAYKTPAKPSTYFLTRYAEALRENISRILNQVQVQNDRPGGAELPERLLNALKSVAAHLEPLHPDGDAALLAARLRQKVESSGLFLEKKLEQVVSALPKDSDKLSADILQLADRLARGDLKAQLMVLKQYFENPADTIERMAADCSKQLSRAVTGMLSEIAEQQSSTRQTDPGQLFHVVLYALPIRDAKRTGLLKMYFPKKKGGDRDRSSFRLSLLLSLDRLGEIRSDLVLREKDLTVMFFVSHQRARAHVQAHLDSMKKSLLSFFPRVALSVTLAEQKLQEFETDVLRIAGDSQIDMRV